MDSECYLMLHHSFRVLQSAAECCRVLQSAAECCRVLQSAAECSKVLQRTRTLQISPYRFGCPTGLLVSIKQGDGIVKLYSSISIFLAYLQIEMLSMKSTEIKREFSLHVPHCLIPCMPWASCWEMFADYLLYPNVVGQIDFLIFLHAVFNGGHNFARM